MQIQTYEQRVLIPEDGMFLCNMEAKTFSPDNQVFLAKDADVSEWIEVTADEKARLEAEWEVIT